MRNFMASYVPIGSSLHESPPTTGRSMRRTELSVGMHASQESGCRVILACADAQTDRQTNRIRRWIRREGHSLGRALLNGAERERYPSRAMDRSSRSPSENEGARARESKREGETARKREREREAERREERSAPLRGGVYDARPLGVERTRESVDHGEKRR